MKEKILKTYPKPFLLYMTLIGIVFFGLISTVNYPIQDNKIDYGVLIIFLLFLFGSVGSFYYFTTYNIVKLYRDRLVISYLFLPYNKTLDLNDIERIEQIAKEVKPLIKGSPMYIYTAHSTIIKLYSGKQYKIETIDPVDFNRLRNCFIQIRHKQNITNNQKRSYSEFFLGNLDGMTWALLMTIITVGLVYGLFF
jgi:hypothetical protein